MNYIEQVNVFWLLDAEHYFNGNESRLYFYLLKLSNSLYWKNPLTNADGYTASMVGISVNTLKTARNRLQQAGLIKFKSGGNGARDKCLYEIIEASKIINKVSNSDTLLAESLTPYPQPNLQNTDDIIKHKQKKEKELGEPSSPPAPKSLDEKQKDFEKRKHSFGLSLQPFVAEYTRAMVNDFFRYWSEPTKSKTKMKWELEKTWETKRRLDKWRTNADKFDSKKAAPAKATSETDETLKNLIDGGKH